MIATTINVLNEKGLRYKVIQDNGVLTLVFGVMTHGTKNKVSIITNENEIIAKIFDTEKKFTEESSFGAFIDVIAELKAVQEKETNLIEQLKKAE